MKGDQIEKVWSEGRRNEYAGKGMLLYRLEKGFYCGDENFFCIRKWWRRRCCGDVDVMRAVR